MQVDTRASPDQRRLAIGLLFAIVLGFLVLSILADASAASGRLTIRLKGVLHIGQVIIVSGSGFTPGDTVYLAECYRNHCDATSATPARVNAGGLLLPTRFKLVPVFAAPMACGSQYSRICTLAVGNVSGGDTGRIALNFAKIK